MFPFCFWKGEEDVIMPRLTDLVIYGSHPFADTFGAHPHHSMGSGQLFCPLWHKSHLPWAYQLWKEKRHCKLQLLFGSHCSINLINLSFLFFFPPYLLSYMSMCASMKLIERPHTLLEEDPQTRRGSPLARVEKMFELIRAKLPGPPDFILCVLAERKNSDIYGMDFPVS